MSDLTLGNWTLEDDEANDELVFTSLNTSNELRFDNGGGFSANGSLDIPHSATHESGGADELDVTGLSGDLADAQDPKTHSTTHENGGVDEISVAGLPGDLADAQDPKTHASTHSQGGGDEVTVENLGTDGSAGTVPTSDGAGGLTMATAGGDTTSDAVRVTSSSNQSIAADDFVKVQFDNTVYDTGNNFDTGTHVYTCPQDGLYVTAFQLVFTGGGSGDQRISIIGTGSDTNPFGEGARNRTGTTGSTVHLLSSTATVKSAGGTISFYGVNLDSSDTLRGGGSAFSSFAEIVYIGDP